MRRGVLDHRVVLTSCGTLLVAALRDAAADALEPIDELIADGLELADAGDARGRPGDRLGNRLRDTGLGGVLGISGELGFDTGDLIAQGPPGGALALGVGDLGRVWEEHRLRDPHGLRLP